MTDPVVHVMLVLGTLLPSRENTPPEAWSLFEAASHDEQAGRKQEALEKYQKAVEIFPAFEGAWLNLAMIHQDMGHLRLSITTAKRALEQVPRSSAIWMVLGNFYGRMGNMDSMVEEAYRKSVEYDPDNPIALANLGMLLAKKGNLEEAEETLVRSREVEWEGLVESIAQQSIIWAQIALLRAKLKRHEDAISACEKALELDRTSPSTLVLVSETYLEIGEPEKAKNLRRETLEQKSRSAEGKEAYRRVPAPDGASDSPLCQESIEKGPRRQELVQFINEGGAQYAAGKLREAEACYRMALEINERDPVAWGMLATVLREQGRRDESEKAFIECFRSDQAPVPQFRANYATLLKELGREDEAERVLLQLTTEHPEFTLGWFNLGNAHLKKREWMQADQAYRIALEQKPDPTLRGRIMWNRGFALKEMSDYENAETSLQNALDIEPTNSKIRELLDEVRHLRGGDMKLDSMLRAPRELVMPDGEAIKIQFSDADIERGKRVVREKQARMREGYRLLSEGRVDEALVVARELNSSSPSIPMFQELMANVLLAKGQYQEALTTIEGVLAKQPSFAEAWLTKGEALTGLGRMKEAEASMRQALALRPDSTQIRAHVDRWRVLTGQRGRF